MRNIILFFEKDWAKEEKILLLLNCILGGLIVGLIFSSSKKSAGKRRISYSLPKEDYWIDDED